MKKKLSIALLAFSLAMLCANFLVRRVKGVFPPPQQEIEEQHFSPFAAVKQNNNETVTDTTLLVLQNEEGNEQAVSQEKQLVKPILKIELTEEEKQKIEIYSKNPKLQDFIKEISTVISQEELEQKNYLQVVYKPEVRNIFIKYARDEEFRKVAAEIMKDKNLLELAKKIINNNEVKK